jgi:AcrR family transcriptional regulator
MLGAGGTTPETAATMTDQYHHGDLPNALRAAAVEVINEKGLGSFSLREVARRAGVSHAAPAHHFGDTTGLLTSLAVEAMHKLYEATSAAAEGIDDPAERLAAIGRAYVTTGVRYPAHCQVAFRTDLVDHDDPGYQAAGMQAYGVLERTVQAVADAYNPALDVTEAAALCWSAMQGLLVLHPKMVHLGALHGRPAPDLEETVTRFTQLMLDGFRGR